MSQETPLQRVITTLAANRCYACGWPLGTCQPFNCAMRYNDDQKHIAEREKWHERATEMNEVLGAILSARPEALEKNTVLEQAARACEKLAERRFEEHGFREPDTNATYYGGHAAEEYDTRDEEDADCAAAVRALKTIPSPLRQKP